MGEVSTEPTKTSTTEEVKTNIDTISPSGQYQLAETAIQSLRSLGLLPETASIPSEQRLAILGLCDQLSRRWRSHRKCDTKAKKKQKQRRRRRLERQRKARLRQQTRIRNPLVSPWCSQLHYPCFVSSTSKKQLQLHSAATPSKPLSFPSPCQCYICHELFTEIHHFYDRLCLRCGDKNFGKRQQKGDLTGYVALVTGGRSEIGMQVALFLLRANCLAVIVTSRFPEATRCEFALQPDYATWKHALDVQGLNLRHLQHVRQFCEDLGGKYSAIDIVIHNAAQTVAMPKKAYSHLLQLEAENFYDGAEIVRPNDAVPFQDHAFPCMFGGSAQKNTYSRSYEMAMKQLGLESGVDSDDSVHADTEEDDCVIDIHTDETDNESNCSVEHDRVEEKTTGSLELCWKFKIPYEETDEAYDGDIDSGEISEAASDTQDSIKTSISSDNKTDQQSDMRFTNSWHSECPDVAIEELQDVMTINAMAPFLMNGLLKPQLQSSRNPYQFIVHVTSAEGQFQRNKTTRHPHTNMAKAALNMHTRTSATEFLRDGILMLSVDPGWVTNRTSSSKTTTSEQSSASIPPLDAIDAAARIVDPIFMAVTSDRVHFGVLLQHYEPAPW